MKAQVMNSSDESTETPPASSAGGTGYESRGPKPGSERHDDSELARWYANLEIPYGSDLKTAHKAWRQLLRKYHPDLHSSDARKREIATELTQGLNHAYQELEKRLKHKT